MIHLLLALVVVLCLTIAPVSASHRGNVNEQKDSVVHALEASPDSSGKSVYVAGGQVEKHYFCWEPSQHAGACKTCWSNLDGEAGRVDCAVRMGTGSVSYGDCSEERNKRWCQRRLD